MRSPLRARHAMQAAAHRVTWHGRRVFEAGRAPVWRAVRGHVQKKYGPDKFPSYDEFLTSSTDVYRFLQAELLAAESMTHLQALCTDDMWPYIRATGAEFEKVRRHLGADQCHIKWKSTEAYVCSLGPPAVPDDGEAGEAAEAGEGEAPGLQVVAGARFFSVLHMPFA